MVDISLISSFMSSDVCDKMLFVSRGFIKIIQVNYVLVHKIFDRECRFGLVIMTPLKIFQMKLMLSECYCHDCLGCYGHESVNCVYALDCRPLLEY